MWILVVCANVLKYETFLLYLSLLHTEQWESPDILYLFIYNIFLKQSIKYEGLFNCKIPAKQSLWELLLVNTVALFLYSESGWCDSLQQNLIFFKKKKKKENTHPQQLRASFREMAGKCILTLWLTTLCPVTHAICSSQQLCSAPHWFTKTPSKSPVSILGRVRVTERYQPIPDGFQNVGLRGRKCWKEHWFSFVEYDKPCARVQLSGCKKKKKKCSRKFSS